MNEDSDGHYYAMHVTIEHQDDVPTDAYTAGQERGFQVTGADTFSSLETRFSRAQVNLASWCYWLNNNGHKVIAYRLEDVILDSRLDDDTSWLG